jgi:hypothetical protein
MQLTYVSLVFAALAGQAFGIIFVSGFTMGFLCQ